MKWLQVVVIAVCLGIIVAALRIIYGSYENIEHQRNTFHDKIFVCRNPAGQLVITAPVHGIEIVTPNLYRIYDDKNEAFFYSKSEFETCMIVPRKQSSGNDA